MEKLAWINPLATVVIVALLLAVESAAPEFVGRARRTRHGLTNAAMGLLNGLAIALPLAAAMVAVTRWAGEHHVGLLNLVSWPAWAEWLVALVLFDAWMYGWHVANHKLPILWRFHRVHHTDDQLDVTSALRFHAGEITLSSVARLAVLPLLGMTIDQLIVYGLTLQPIILFHHSNVRIPRRVDTAMRWLIVTPWMHWVHHSDQRPETDSNYASVLSVWDRLFRTFRLRDDPTTIRLGLPDAADREAHNLGGMLAAPFHRAKSSEAAAPPRDEKSSVAERNDGC